MQSMVVTHTHAKDQGQRSVGSKDRVETDRQMDGSDYITSCANAVGNDSVLLEFDILRLQCCYHLIVLNTDCLPHADT